MAGYIGPAPVPQATQNREAFTATSGQTSFATAGYTPQFIDVYLNGVKLAAADYTATNGSDVVLASGATANDILEVVAFSAFTVADQAFTGTTTAANLTVTGAFTSQGIDDNADAVAITIDSSENVGIGTSSPYTLLELSSIDPILRFNDSNGGTDTKNFELRYVGTNSPDIDGLYFRTVNDANTVYSDKMVILGSGNVGIGTSSPSEALHVSNASNPALHITNTDATNGCTLRLAMSTNGAFIGLKSPQGGSDALRFGTGNEVERMRITSGGTLQIAGGGNDNVGEINMGNTAQNANRFQVRHQSSAWYLKTVDSEPLVFGTANTERMRITSAGNVGIGTSSPSNKLDVSSSSEVVTRFSRSGGSNALLLISDPTTTTAPYIASYGNAMAFGRYAGGESMRIDSSGNLIVGGTTDGAASSITLQHDGDIRGVLASGAGGDTIISAISGVSNGYQIAVDTSNNQTYRWHNGGTQSMTLDSSGNLLVGKTASSISTVGGQINANGQIRAIASGLDPIFVNRLTSDGDIIKIAKDGTTVGSIMSYFGDMVTGTGDVGIRWEDGGDLLTPWNPSTNLPRPSAIDLGATSVPFKDLYLSGGVYLGGTGAANQLDDYEEGTWTPQLLINNSSSGIAYNGRDGSYTKVGRLVTLMGYVHLSSKGTTAGGVSIAGLPFTTGDSLGTTSFNGTGTFWFDNMASAKSNLICWVDDLNAEMYLRHTAGSGSTVYQNTAASDITNTFDIRFVVHYFTS